MQILSSETQFSNTEHATARSAMLEAVGESLEIDALRYPSVSVQLDGTFTGTVQFEVSNDGDTWLSKTLFSTTGAAATEATALGMWTAGTGARFFRVRVSALTDGAVGVHSVFSTNPARRSDATVELQDAAIAGRIADDESATRTQLNATFVSPLKDALSNAVNGLYLPSQTCLFKWRQRRSLTVTGAQQAHVAIIGDSIADGAAVTSPRPVNSWPGVLRAMLARQYGDAGTGLVIMDKNLRANPTRDPRVTWVGAITDLAAGFHKQACARIDGPGGSPTNYVMFTPEQAVEAFTVWNLKGAGGANRYQIDSDTTKTFRNVPHVYSNVQPRAGDNAGHYVQTMQATSKGVHTLKVWPDSDAAGYDLFLTAVEGFNDDPGTFRVSNPSISGRSLWSLFGGASMNDEAFAWAGLPLIDMLRSDLLVIALGVNDWLTGVSVAQAKAWLKVLIQRQRSNVVASGGGTTANGDVLLVWNPQPDLNTLGPTTGSATWDEYRAMFYEVANEEDVALLDLGMRWGGFDNADARGFYPDLDHIHPLDAPTRDMAVAVYAAIHA